MTDQASSRTRQVVAIDDEPSIIVVITASLQPNGFEVSAAPNGPQGLELIARIKPDLVLLDLLMPDMNGLEVLQRLKADPDLQQIPVVIVSAMTDPGGRSQCLKSGAADYLAKPFSPYELLDMINSVLGLADS
jgi:CheY-like chemotaxis protein